MGEALVGAMVAAMRRANRDRADAARAAEREAAPRPEGSAWGYLVHPALMPTVYSPSGEAQVAAPLEEVVARKV
jgi:ABC-type nitrate/sulfonate/bicarbonate transport system substrate-binding protein